MCLWCTIVIKSYMNVVPFSVFFILQCCQFNKAKLVRAFRFALLCTYVSSRTIFSFLSDLIFDSFFTDGGVPFYILTWISLIFVKKTGAVEPVQNWVCINIKVVSTWNVNSKSGYPNEHPPSVLSTVAPVKDDSDHYCGSFGGFSW